MKNRKGRGSFENGQAAGEFSRNGFSVHDRYNRRDFLKHLFRLKEREIIEPETLEEIFTAERQSLVPLMLLETILLYIFAPLLGTGVFAWYGLIFVLTLWRYYNAQQYRKNPTGSRLELWHRKFAVQVWMTALLFALLALFAIPILTPYYQLFLLLVIIGISTGTVKSMGRDQRTAIGYLLILLVPLIVEMMLLGREEMWILAFLTLLYLVSQLKLLLDSYERHRALKRARRQMRRTRELLHEKQEMLQRFFEQAAEGIFTYDSELRILDCNRSFLNFFDLSKGSIIGQRITELRDKRLAAILQAAQVDGAASFQGPYRNPAGTEHWIDARCSAIRDRSGHMIGGIGLIQDKTREHLVIEELEFQVTHDPMTASCNRRGFQQFMQRLVRNRQHEKRPSLLFYLDVDRFKLINDLFGHETGDRLLIEGSRRLRQMLPDEACLTRMGGDEFSIVIPFVETKPGQEEEVIQSWFERFKASLSLPYRIGGSENLEVNWSIGVVVIEPGTREIGDLIRRADISMMQAKKNPGRGYVRYANEMGEYYRELTQINHDLRTALKTGQFLLHFQPIVRVGNGELIGAEVLLRWQHPVRGLIPPGEFLSVARQFNLISEIDLWVLERACSQIDRWKRSDCGDFPPLSVNIDAQLLLRENFPAILSDLFRKYGVDEGELMLEITEDSLIDRFDQAVAILQQLRSQGIKCAIDDFGTGYSSLSYLQRLSFDILKIDREFVRERPDTFDNLPLLRSIIDMGKKLDYQIIVEGVETGEQRAIIADIDPDIGCQGYLISRPISGELFHENFLCDHDRTP